jgi:hypothetical protein
MRRPPSIVTLATLAWLANPHPPMPNFNLSRTEIDWIVAYLASLRRP